MSKRKYSNLCPNDELFTQYNFQNAENIQEAWQDYKQSTPGFFKPYQDSKDFGRSLVDVIACPLACALGFMATCTTTLLLTEVVRPHDVPALIFLSALPLFLAILTAISVPLTVTHLMTRGVATLVSLAEDLKDSLLKQDSESEQSLNLQNAGL